MVTQGLGWPKISFWAQLNGHCRRIYICNLDPHASSNLGLIVLPNCCTLLLCLNILCQQMFEITQLVPLSWPEVTSFWLYPLCGGPLSWTKQHHPHPVKAPLTRLVSAPVQQLAYRLGFSDSATSQLGPSRIGLIAYFLESGRLLAKLC